MTERSADHREPVIVATFADVGEADVAQAKLRAFGIEAVIVDQVEGGAIPTVEVAGGGIGLEVRAADAAAASEILSGRAEGEGGESEGGESEGGAEPA